jgi:hypothetical protein
MIVKYLYDNMFMERCVEIGDDVVYKDTFVATPHNCRKYNISDSTATKIANYLNRVGPNLTIDGKPIPPEGPVRL